MNFDQSPSPAEIYEWTFNCPPLGFPDEKTFVSFVGSHLKELGCFWYKMPDTGYDRKPYDAFFVSPDGETYHLEAKVLKKDSLPASDFQDQQRHCLNEVAKRNPDSAVVAAYSKSRNKMRIFRWTDYRECCKRNGSLSAKIFD